MNLVNVLTTIGFKWIVNYSFTTNDSRIEHWFRFAFKFDIMMSLHGVNFVKSYLHIMKYGATNGSL
jgi:hypothetical protein